MKQAHCFNDCFYFNLQKLNNSSPSRFLVYKVKVGFWVGIDAGARLYLFIGFVFEFCLGSV